MKIKGIVLISLISLISAKFFSQGFPPPKDSLNPENSSLTGRTKKHFPLERKPDEPFVPVFLKTWQEENYIFLEVIFNSTVRKESVFGAPIFLDNQPVEKEFILFSRDGHRCKFRIFYNKENYNSGSGNSENPNENDKINIKMAGILSWDGLMIPPFEITGICKNSMYRFDRESGQWQKFSL